MDFEFAPGNISIKIKSTPSVAKAISIIRKYNPVSMSVIKSAIESQEYVLEHSVLSTPGIRATRKCYDELIKAGNEVEIYEQDRLISREILSNLINSHRLTEREVRAQVDAEVETQGSDDD